MGLSGTDLLSSLPPRKVGAVRLGSSRQSVRRSDDGHSFFFFFCLFAFSWATPAVYGGSQARGLIGAVAAGLGQSHSKGGSEPCLRPTPQLPATSDP